MKVLTAVLVCLLSICASAAQAAQAAQAAPPRPHAPTEAQIQARQRSDAQAVQVYRAGLRDAIAYAASQPALFPVAAATQPRLLSHEQRAAVRALWQRVSDYYLALDSIARQHAGWHADVRRLPLQRRVASFHVGHAAFLAQYRAALEFIEATRHEPGLAILLNEAMPELGLPAGSFDRFKFRFLNVARATEFSAAELLRGQYRPPPAELRSVQQEDAAAILRQGQGAGPAMTIANAFDIVRKAGFQAWFPVQAGVAEWMGDTKVYRLQRSLVSAQQIAALSQRLEPGDILLERREWYVSNIGLPGYWPHAALYVGTAAERVRYFDTDDVRAWVRAQGEASGEFERLLAQRAAAAHADSGKPLEHGHAARVIEAISEGVSFTSIEHSAAADSLAVLRPRSSRAEKAHALLRAFVYVGRPYDFNFDFRSDAALVCSELVFKAYEPASGMRGLSFPMTDVLGRIATSPNDMVRQFDEQFGTAEQQTDFVVFLDGHERDNRAVDAPVAEFRASWRRPKWHLATQSLQAGGTPKPDPGSAGRRD